MLLEVKNLHTYFKTKKGIVKAVNDVTYGVFGVYGDVLFGIGGAFVQ